MSDIVTFGYKYLTEITILTKMACDLVLKEVAYRACGVSNRICYVQYLLDCFIGFHVINFFTSLWNITKITRLN